MKEEAQIVHDVQVAVVEERQIVSFKWIAREYNLPIMQAKRLLQKFAQERKEKLHAIYLLSGWTKEARQHLVQLIPEDQLIDQESRMEKITGKYVYSVQPKALKDPSALWSTDYTQMSSLFSEPLDVDNNLRSNQLSSLASKTVQRVLSGHQGTGPNPYSGGGGKKSNSTEKKEQKNVPPTQNGGISLGNVAGSSKGISLNSPRPSTKQSSPSFTKTETKKGISLDGGGPKRNPSKSKGTISLSGAKAAKGAAKGERGGARTPLPEKKPEEMELAMEEKAQALHEEDDAVVAKPSERAKRNTSNRLLLSESEEEEEDEQSEDKMEICEDEYVELGQSSPAADDAIMDSPAVEKGNDQANKQGKGTLPSVKRKKVFRTVINEKGEEVTESFWEETQVEETQVAGAKQIGNENSNPNPPAKKPAEKPRQPKKVNNAQKKQRGIASFFAKK